MVYYYVATEIVIEAITHDVIINFIRSVVEQNSTVMDSKSGTQNQLYSH